MMKRVFGESDCIVGGEIYYLVEYFIVFSFNTLPHSFFFFDIFSHHFLIS